MGYPGTYADRTRIVPSYTTTEVTGSSSVYGTGTFGECQTYGAGSTGAPPVMPLDDPNALACIWSLQKLYGYGTPTFFWWSAGNTPDWAVPGGTPTCPTVSPSWNTYGSMAGAFEGYGIGISHRGHRSTGGLDLYTTEGILVAWGGTGVSLDLPLQEADGSLLTGYDVAIQLASEDLTFTYEVRQVGRGTATIGSHVYLFNGVQLDVVTPGAPSGDTGAMQVRTGGFGPGNLSVPPDFGSAPYIDLGAALDTGTGPWIDVSSLMTDPGDTISALVMPNLGGGPGGGGESNYWIDAVMPGLEMRLTVQGEAQVVTAAAEGSSEVSNAATLVAIGGEWTDPDTDTYVHQFDVFSNTLHTVYQATSFPAASSIRTGLAIASTPHVVFARFQSGAFPDADDFGVEIIELATGTRTIVQAAFPPGTSYQSAPGFRWPIVGWDGTYAYVFGSVNSSAWKAAPGDTEWQRPIVGSISKETFPAGTRLVMRNSFTNPFAGSIYDTSGLLLGTWGAPSISSSAAWTGGDWYTWWVGPIGTTGFGCTLQDKDNTILWATFDLDGNLVLEGTQTSVEALELIALAGDIYDTAWGGGNARNDEDFIVGSPGAPYLMMAEPAYPEAEIAFGHPQAPPLWVHDAAYLTNNWLVDLVGGGRTFAGQSGTQTQTALSGGLWSDSPGVATFEGSLNFLADISVSDWDTTRHGAVMARPGFGLRLLDQPYTESGTSTQVAREGFLLTALLWGSGEPQSILGGPGDLRRHFLRRSGQGEPANTATATGIRTWER